MVISEKRQEVNKLLGGFTAKASEDFMTLSSGLKRLSADAELVKHVDKMFRRIMELNKILNGEIESVLNSFELLENKITHLSEEKTRLQKLYSSGILFQSETEMKSLMDKAIDTIVNELDADEGFIVLVDSQRNIETIVAKNMDPDNAPSARELSTSIIKNTLNSLQPLQINDINSEDDLSIKNSVISLGLSAAICVPLVSGKRVLGAVYIDRRNQSTPFKDSDLLFLISFARQVVRGIEVSIEIQELEEKLEEKPKQEFRLLREEFRSDELIGGSKKLFNVIKIASRVSATNAPVFVLGENGTGKELIARAIHFNSPRHDRPFVAVNCGAIPADLLESELFGYESGAFSGAAKSKPGRFEIADGGTIFLDEIGEMSVNLQAKLLRFIQTKEIERLGGVQSKLIDVRFISATNRDISKMISEKSFREDLYYRLKVIEIKMPPLRERKEDIEELVKAFFAKYAPDKNEFTISDNALGVLENYNWPGNIRELESVVQRSIILSKSNLITHEDLPPEIYDPNGQDAQYDPEETLSGAEDRFRKLYITRVLRKAGSKSEAARLLGINRSHLHKLIASLEITE